MIISLITFDLLARLVLVVGSDDEVGQGLGGLRPGRGMVRDVGRVSHAGLDRSPVGKGLDDGDGGEEEGQRRAAEDGGHRGDCC